jgi:hypothetical protein
MVVRSAAGKSSVAAEFAPTVITSDAILNQHYTTTSHMNGQLTNAGGP